MIYSRSQRKGNMVTPKSESGKTLGHEMCEIEGLFRLYCHRCRKDVAHNLPDPSRDPSAKRAAILAHQKLCKAKDFEFTTSKQMKSRLE